MIRLTRPDVAGAHASLKTLLEGGLLVQGKTVESFEQAVAAYVGRGCGVALNSGTSAIQCAVMSIGIGKGDQVVLPDFTFPATANAVVCAGATPVLADIDPVTFNLDPESVIAEITPATRAIMPVDLFGLPSDLDSITTICAERELLLVEDSACALGASYKGRRCGSFGEVSAISFHPRKIVTTGEGGMVLTDRSDAADTVRRLRNHGIDVSDGGARFVLAGYNMRMNEMEACLGVTQMANIDDMVQDRRRAAALYDELLLGLDEITAPLEPDGMFHTYQSYVTMVDARIDRDGLIASMRKKGVETAIGTYSIHVQPFYREMLGHKPGKFPSSYHAFRHSLALPIYASMEEETVRQVVTSLKECTQRLIAGK
ncbi:MAG: DegT/DnrJ/EryC1/StrS family aminotransferase [Candidatus Eisenbacteria bacterium]